MHGMGSQRRKNARAALLQRQGPRCYYCARVMPPESLTLDHLVPRSKGGTNAQSNLVLACKRCNGTKGNNLTFDPAKVKRKPPSRKAIGPSCADRRSPCEHQPQCSVERRCVALIVLPKSPSQ